MEGIDASSTDSTVNITSSTGASVEFTREFNPVHTKLELYEIPQEYIKDYSEYRHVLEQCNDTLYSESYPKDGELYCNATWDTMQCWGYTKAGTTEFQQCPPYITLSNPMAFSKKTCNADGTWFRHPETGNIWTNYSMCYDHSLFEQHKQVLYMYYYGYSISIVLLVTSLIIFSMFRQLKCVRVTLHKHLFISYVFNGAMWILYYSLVPMDPDVLLHNPAWCQILHVLTHYFTVCNYAWMFCEGFYIHAIIVITFTKDTKLLKICYVIGWVFPLLPIAIYTCIRALSEPDNERCWTSSSVFNWILAGPINASLIHETVKFDKVIRSETSLKRYSKQLQATVSESILYKFSSSYEVENILRKGEGLRASKTNRLPDPINFIFSINIMRILLSKLRSVHNQETMQTRRAVRATLILIPLLGIQFIAFPFKPPPGSDGEHTYSMIIACVTSVQGVFVSLVFCFFNGEVIKSFKKWYHHLKLSKSKNFNSSSRHRQNGETSVMMRSVSQTERVTSITDLGSSRGPTSTETSSFLAS